TTPLNRGIEPIGWRARRAPEPTAPDRAPLDLARRPLLPTRSGRRRSTSPTPNVPTRPTTGGAAPRASPPSRAQERPGRDAHIVKACAQPLARYSIEVSDLDGVRSSYLFLHSQLPRRGRTNHADSKNRFHPD